MTGMAEWRQQLDDVLRRHEHLPSARWMQLATVRADGTPANRTVVLRFFVGDALVFTTDLRSGKVAELAHSPWAEACAYFGETRQQFRILGRVATIDENASGDEAAARRRAWGESSPSSRQTFTWPPPSAPRADDAAFDHAAPEEAPPSFGILILTPERVETLNLRPHPHARTLHTLRDGAWTIEEINP